MVCNSSRRNRSSRLDEKEEKRGGWLVVYYRSPKGLLLFGRRWRATRRRERASHLHQRENRSTECGWNSRLPRTHARPSRWKLFRCFSFFTFSFWHFFSFDYYYYYSPLLSLFFLSLAFFLSLSPHSASIGRRIMSYRSCRLTTTTTNTGYYIQDQSFFHRAI